MLSITFRLFGLTLFLAQTVLCQNSVSNMLKPLLVDNIEWDYCFPITNEFIFTWKFIPENDTVTLGVSSLTTGWVGIGWNQDDAMIGADAFIGRFVNGEPDIGDYFLDAEEECEGGKEGVCLDSQFGGHDNTPLLFLSGRTQNSTWFAYNRARQGQDAKLDTTIPTDSEIVLVWAFGEEDEIEEHPGNGIGTLSMNFANPGILSCPYDCSGHGRCIGACCICEEGWTFDDCSHPEGERNQFGFDSSTIDPIDYEFNGDLNSELKIYWSILLDEATNRTYLDAALHSSGSDSGWIGLGFAQGSGGHMSPADVIICMIGDQSSVSDWQFDDRSTEGTRHDADENQENGSPSIDNIISWTTSSENGMSCKFRRFLDTRDTVDQVITNETLKCIWAVHDETEWDEHSFRERGRVKINFFTGEIKFEPNYWVVHGVLMFLGWGAFVPIVSMLARNFKWIGHPWFEIHRGVQILSMLMSTAAFAVAIVMVERDGNSHFVGAHQTIGIILFILGWIQPVIGQLADFMFDPQREKMPIFPDRIHGVIGWLCVMLAVVNIFLGINIYESSATVWILYIIWVCLLFVAFLAFQVLEKLKLFPEHPHEK